MPGGWLLLMLKFCWNIPGLLRLVFVGQVDIVGDEGHIDLCIGQRLVDGFVNLGLDADIVITFQPISHAVDQGRIAEFGQFYEGNLSLQDPLHAQYSLLNGFLNQFKIGSSQYPQKYPPGSSGLDK